MDQRNRLHSTSLLEEPGRNITAYLWSDGDVTIEGHDLGLPGPSGATEYEWFVTIRADSIPAFRTALGAQDQEAVLEAVLRRSGDILAMGETAWLQQHKIAYEFFSC